MAFRMAPLNVGERDRTERAFGLLVSDGYFPALGVRPVLGRVLEPGEVATPGGAPVAVVSYRFWQSRLAGDPAAVGRTVRVNGVELSVVGVLPDGFQGTVLGLQFDLWVPATMAPVILGGSRELEDRRSRGYYVMARLPRAAQVRAVAATAAAAMPIWPSAIRRAIAASAPRCCRIWRAPRGPQRMFLQALGCAAGPDAGAAARRVRQHRDAAAGASGVAAARARRAPRHGRVAVARGPAAAGRVAGRRRARRRPGRRAGRLGQCRRCAPSR